MGNQLEIFPWDIPDYKTDNGFHEYVFGDLIKGYGLLISAIYQNPVKPKPWIFLKILYNVYSFSGFITFLLGDIQVHYTVNLHLHFNRMSCRKKTYIY